MSKDNKTTTDSRNVQLPKSPAYLRDAIEGVTGAVYNLGNRDPLSYVPGASGLQRQSFNMGSNIANRYGAGSARGGGRHGASAPFSNTNNSGSGGGLFEQLGVRSPNHFNYDWQKIGADRAAREPGFVQGFNSLTEQNHRDIAELLGSPDQRINQGQYAQYMRDYDQPWSPEMEARFRSISGGTQSQSYGAPNTVNMGGGMYGPGGFDQPRVKVSPDGGGASPYNPLDAYGDATGLTRDAATAGPQHGNYGGVLDFLRANAPSATAGNVQAHSVLDNWESYMNPFTDRVVDTTLANFDEHAARAEARRAAAAAGSGAFRGTRDGVNAAIAQIERERERAAIEAGLRGDAFDTGMGLSADDANRRQSASATNAQLATQVSMANAQSDLSRLLSGANLMHQGIANNQQADENSLDRQMQGSRDLVNAASTYQGNERADLGLLSALGAQERQVQQQQATADLGLLSTITQLASQLGINTSQVTGIVNNGTQTTTQTPGLLEYLNTGVNLAAAGTGMAGWKDFLSPPPGPTVPGRT